MTTDNKLMPTATISSGLVKEFYPSVPANADKVRVRPIEALPLNADQRFEVLVVTGQSGPTKACSILLCRDRQTEGAPWCVVGDDGSIWSLDTLAEPTTSDEKAILTRMVRDKSPEAASYPLRRHVRAVGSWGGYSSRSKLAGPVEALQRVLISGPTAWQLTAENTAGERAAALGAMAMYVPTEALVEKVAATVVAAFPDCPWDVSTTLAAMAIKRHFPHTRGYDEAHMTEAGAGESSN